MVAEAVIYFNALLWYLPVGSEWNHAKSTVYSRFPE